MSDWKFEMAASQSDLEWKSLSVDKEWANIKTWSLLSLLFVFSVFLITPLMLQNNATKIMEQLDLHHALLSQNAINAYVATASVLLVNVVLIPFIIDMMVLVEDF